MKVEKAYPEAADAAVAGLRYGSVCVNISSVLGFGITRLTWGAFPGHTLQVYVVLCTVLCVVYCVDLSMRATICSSLVNCLSGPTEPIPCSFKISLAHYPRSLFKAPD